MVEILPIKVLREEDSQVFGNLNVVLGDLLRSGLPVADGIVVSPPTLKLKTTLEYFDFGSKEVFEQSLVLVKKELRKIPIPEVLRKETRDNKRFLLNKEIIDSVVNLWPRLLDLWIEQIKQRLWREGFTKGVTEGLSAQAVFFVKRVDSFGRAYHNYETKEISIEVEKGSLHPNDLKRLDELVVLANKRLFIPHIYSFICDGSIKLTQVLPFTPDFNLPPVAIPKPAETVVVDKKISAVKVLADLSVGLVVDREVDGVYIRSEKTFDLNTPRSSFEETLFKLVESAITFENRPVLFKLADISEGMGGIRGALRLKHQKNLLDPLLDVLVFARFKKHLLNIYPVIPFVRSVNEFLDIKRELAVKKLIRKNSMKLWLEVAIPENILNLEEYLVAGLDGIVLNLDELTAYLVGFDHGQEELYFYKKQISALLRFLEDGIKLLHKSKTPFIACGSMVTDPQILEFLVEKGIYGVVVERYESYSIHSLLNQMEKRIILRRSS